MRSQAVGVDDNQLARFDFPNNRGTHDVERCSLTSDDPSTLEASKDEGTYPLGITGGVQGVVVHEDQRERTEKFREFLQRRLFEWQIGVSREKARNDFRIGGRMQTGVDRQFTRCAGQFRQPLGQVCRVGEVSVVPEGQVARRRWTERRLGVLPHARTRSGVARVTDRDVSVQ